MFFSLVFIPLRRVRRASRNVCRVCNLNPIGFVLSSCNMCAKGNFSFKMQLKHFLLILYIHLQNELLKESKDFWCIFGYVNDIFCN
jgi:hypothetical protein